jgi:hypothetical protein
MRRTMPVETIGRMTGSVRPATTTHVGAVVERVEALG